jgi:hypothetical protein
MNLVHTASNFTSFDYVFYICIEALVKSAVLQYVIICSLSREQDEDLDDLSATVVRLGDVGLTIHGELSSQVLPLSTAFPLADDYKKSSVTFLDVAHLSPWYPSHQEKYDFIVWEVEHIHEDFITTVMVCPSISVLHISLGCTVSVLMKGCLSG